MYYEIEGLILKKSFWQAKIRWYDGSVELLSVSSKSDDIDVVVEKIKVLLSDIGDCYV